MMWLILIYNLTNFLTELGSENLIICCDILKAYIYLCPDEFLAVNIKLKVDGFKLLITILLFRCMDLASSMF